MQIDPNAPAVTRQERVLHAAPEVVFALLADVADWPRWQPDVSESEIVGAGSLEVGTSFRWKSGGASIVSTVETLTAPTAIGWSGRAIGPEPCTSGSSSRSPEARGCAPRSPWRDGCPEPSALWSAGCSTRASPPHWTRWNGRSGVVETSARIAWGCLGLAALGAALIWGSWWLLIAWLVPDLGVLAGGFRMVDERGHLFPRAALGYNAMHALVGPAGTVALALATGSMWVGAVAAVWVSHIGIDRALGHRLKPLHG